jgi:hypothetical protein
MARLDLHAPARFGRAQLSAVSFQLAAIGGERFSETKEQES